jgi:hypothetical protein
MTDEAMSPLRRRMIEDMTVNVAQMVTVLIAYDRVFHAGSCDVPAEVAGSTVDTVHASKVISFSRASQTGSGRPRQ